MSLPGGTVGRAQLARLTGDVAAAGGVRLVELADGAERGVRVVEVRTGTGLCFDVLVDRAMDIGPFEHAGRSIGWRSATGFRHPGLHEHADEQGWGWLRSFSGLLVTAGLDHTLGPAEVDATNFAYQPRGWQPLHGRVANSPARLLGYGERWDDDDACVLWVEGEVRQARVFGEHLRLTRRIEADLGGSDVRLIDTVTNLGGDVTPHMLLYHVNIGWPLLDDGTRLVAPIRRLRWSTSSVIEQGLSYQRFGSPGRGLLEQVYEHEVAADQDGFGAVLLANDRLQLGLELRWHLDELPCLLQWLHLRDGAYAVGIEPSTHGAAGDQAARDDGSMTWLEPGDSRTYRVTFRVHDSSEALTGAAKRIRTTCGQPTDDEMDAAARS